MTQSKFRPSDDLSIPSHLRSLSYTLGTIQSSRPNVDVLPFPNKIDKENTVVHVRVKYALLLKVTEHEVLSVEQLGGLCECLTDNFGVGRMWKGRTLDEAGKRTNAQKVFNHDRMHVADNGVEKV